MSSHPPPPGGPVTPCFHCLSSLMRSVFFSHNAMLRLLKCVFCSSAEEGDAGPHRPPGGPDPPQHHRQEHPDQRRLRAHQPAHPGDPTAPGGQQAPEVGPPVPPPLLSLPSADLVCFRSVYREILFLSLVALGRENIDIGECRPASWLALAQPLSCPVLCPPPHRGLRPGVPASLQPAERRAAEGAAPHGRAPGPRRAVVPPELRDAVHLKTEAPPPGCRAASTHLFLCFSWFCEQPEASLRDWQAPPTPPSR